MSFSVVNNAIRNVSRVLPASMRSLKLTPVNARSLMQLPNSSSKILSIKLSAVSPSSHTGACKCGNCRSVHTRGDKELIEFLSEEIAAEKKSSKSKVLNNLDGFDVKHNGSEIILSKKFNDEQIEITVNVNHSVDAELNEGEINPKADSPPASEMKSRPHFEVKLIKGSQVTRFACSYIQDAGEQVDDGPSDIFTIDELAVYEGNHSEQTYAVAGDILDGYMYDLLMNLLEERGVSNEFVEKLSDLATKREHDLFISLLERLQSFVQGK